MHGCGNARHMNRHDHTAFLSGSFPYRWFDWGCFVSCFGVHDKDSFHPMRGQWWGVSFGLSLLEISHGNSKRDDLHDSLRDMIFASC